MTTKVTVDPAGHMIRIDVLYGAGGTSPTVVLNPGDPPYVAWISGAQVMTVREILADKA